ncbi:outer membrane beta-barrel protein [Pseudomonas graminis]|uniref:OmpW/AlkL family protein n=1 Tax=Pseudomonas graminis TaxID=158627 RepID=UPI0023493A72|nr:OmpW family outer membrane protein [Pseudomonas graminis]MDC6378917.1 outer membrane beta-barrel protein [Pseudomonas graminis]
MQVKWVSHRQYCLFFAALMLWDALALADGNPQIESQIENNDRWLIRVMAVKVIPVDLTSEISVIGGKVDTPQTNQLSMDLSYFLTDHWAVEFQGGPFDREYRVKGSKVGDFKVGSISHTALSMTLQYHFFRNAKLSPYLGLGINHVWTRDVKPAAGIPKFDVRDITSWLVNAGVDYQLSNHWSISTSLRYVVSPEYEFQGQGFNSTVSMNTLVVGGGLGYHF